MKEATTPKETTVTTTTTNDFQQCGQCKGWFPLASTPEQPGLFSHTCSAEPEGRRGADVPKNWESVDAPERTGGGTGAPKKLASDKQVAFILRLQAEKLAIDAMGRPDPDGRNVAQVLESADLDREAHARKMTSAKASKYIDDLMAAPAWSAPVAETVTTGIMAADEAATYVRSDRKFEIDDVTPALHSFAAEWARNWQGDFQFMVDMRESARQGKLSKGQAKGVLNCFRADVLRAGSKPVAEAASAKPADGYEPTKGDVHFVDGEYYRVHIGQQSGNAYAVKAIVVENAKWDYEGNLVEPGIVEWDLAKGMIFKLSTETLASELQAAAFGRLVGRCCFCSFPIDTPESTLVGYGPKCAAKRGMPWGATAQRISKA